MKKYSWIFLALPLAGCGADVATTAAEGAAIKAKEIEEAKKTLDQAQQKLDGALQLGQQKMEEAAKAVGQ